MIRMRSCAVALFAVLLAACEENPVPDDPANQAHYTQCEAGNAESCFRLGQYHQAKGNPKNTIKAYQRSCDLGYVQACQAGGHFLVYERGIPPDYEQVARLFRKGCDGNIMQSCTELAWLYQHGQRGISKNVAKAARLYRKACDGNDVTACTILGRLYRDGTGVSRNRTKSAALFRKACDADRPKACLALAEQHMLGWGVTRSRTNATALLEKACRLGNPEACGTLVPSTATPADPTRTARAWKRAMAAGHPKEVVSGRTYTDAQTRAKKFHVFYADIDRGRVDPELSHYIAQWMRWSKDIETLATEDIRRESSANSIETFSGLVGAMVEKNEEGDRDAESLERGMEKGSRYGRNLANAMNQGENARSIKEWKQLGTLARELTDVRETLRLRLELRYGVPLAPPKE